MGNKYEFKEKIARNQIESLISKMADYLNCEKDDIKILRFRFFNGLFSTHFSIRFINHRKSSLRRIVTSNYYFDIGGEYVEREGIWYEGVFYTYNSPEPFFEVLKLEIEEKSIIK